LIRLIRPLDQLFITAGPGTGGKSFRRKEFGEHIPSFPDGFTLLSNMEPHPPVIIKTMLNNKINTVQCTF
jgi:hypothetical protein